MTETNTFNEDAGTVIPAGMVPWHGGESAPADWDGGPVLLADGERWGPYHASPGWATWDLEATNTRRIIAYTPRTSTHSTVGDDARARAREVLEPFRRGIGGKYDREYESLVGTVIDDVLAAFAEGVVWNDEQRSAYERLAALRGRGEADRPSDSFLEWVNAARMRSGKPSLTRAQWLAAEEGYEA